MRQTESVLCDHNVFYRINVTLGQIVLKNTVVLLVSLLPPNHKGLVPPPPHTYPISLHTAFFLRECITSKQLDFYHGFQLGTRTFVVGKICL